MIPSWKTMFGRDLVFREGVGKHRRYESAWTGKEERRPEAWTSVWACKAGKP